MKTNLSASGTLTLRQLVIDPYGGTVNYKQSACSCKSINLKKCEVYIFSIRTQAERFHARASTFVIELFIARHNLIIWISRSKTVLSLSQSRELQFHLSFQFASRTFTRWWECEYIYEATSLSFLWEMINITKLTAAFPSV